MLFSSPIVRRGAVAIATVAAAAAPLTTHAATTSQLPAGMEAAKHFFWTNTGTPDPTQYENQLINHGGPVETSPKVYLVFWGSQWAQGFKTSDAAGHTYSSAQAQRYVTDFFRNIGGTPWAGVQAQYCDNVPAGTTSCAGIAGAKYVRNVKGVLKGVWVDSSAVPSTIVTSGLAENITQDPIAQEAVRASQHFASTDPSATFFVLTPTGVQATAYGSVYCAYHTEVWPVNGQTAIQYAFMPYVMDYASGCGQNFVNASDNAFGNGFFDGYSMVAGHEWGESVTDPESYPFQNGWNDNQTNENGDKCAWSTQSTDITLGTHQFAVQPMWSNEAAKGAGACALAPGS